MPAPGVLTKFGGRECALKCVDLDQTSTIAEETYAQSEQDEDWLRMVEIASWLVGP